MTAVLFVACVLVALTLWWLILIGLNRRARRGPDRARTTRPHRPLTRGLAGHGFAGFAHRRPRPAMRPPTPPGPPPVMDAQLSVEWANSAQVWPALNAENALLSARLAGRITPIEYRARLADLARRCEPHAADSG